MSKGRGQMLMPPPRRKRADMRDSEDKILREQCKGFIELVEDMKGTMMKTDIKTDVKVKVPKFKLWAREFWEDGELLETVETIEIPFEDYIALIEKKNYYDGYSDGMIRIMSVLTADED